MGGGTDNQHSRNAHQPRKTHRCPRPRRDPHVRAPPRKLPPLHNSERIHHAKARLRLLRRAVPPSRGAPTRSTGPLARTPKATLAPSSSGTGCRCTRRARRIAAGSLSLVSTFEQERSESDPSCSKVGG